MYSLTDLIIAVVITIWVTVPVTLILFSCVSINGLEEKELQGGKNE